MSVFEEALNHILDRVGDACHSVDKESVKEIAEIIAKSPRVFVYGSGRSGVIGKCFATRLVQVGKTAYFIGESTTPIIKKEDSVVLISNTGKTKSTILVASISRNIGAETICLTSSPDNPLAKICNKKLIIKYSNINPDYAPLGTIFEISSLIILDSLIAELMNILGENEESMRGRHAIWV